MAPTFGRWRWPLTAIAILFTIASLHRLRAVQWSLVGLQPHHHSESLLEQQQNFWQLIHSHILDNEPQCDPVNHSELGDLAIGFDPANEPPSRPDRLNLTEFQTQELRRQHRSFTSTIQRAQYALPFNVNTRGIVTTAGGKYLPVAVVSLSMLRETGCELPVEVFLATQDEWDEEICGNIFPQLNARCVVLAEIFDPLRLHTTLGIDKYQYKVMSLVFSSFEEVLFLDSDCFPIYDPTEHFDSAPFTDTGMILWPDFWYPTESPSYFEIAEIPTPDVKLRSSTESGELLYSKSKHTESLLLAIYYNFYGPDFYYPLQSQGAPGEGDKETFRWSAVALEENFYSVRQGVKAMGYIASNGDWRGSAMVQYDAVQDHARGDTDDHVRPMWMHVNFPKIDPGQIFLLTSFGATGPTHDSDGTMRRIWYSTEEESVAFFGYDVERRLWKVVKDIACDYEGKIMAWQGLHDVCKHATEYWTTVFEDIEKSDVE